MNGKKMWSVGAGWSGLQQRRQAGFVCGQLLRKPEVNKDPYCHVKGGVRGYCHPKLLRAAAQLAIPQQWRWHVHRCLSRNGNIVAHGQGDERISLPTMTGMASSTRSWRTILRRGSSFTIWAEEQFEEVGNQAGVAYAPDGAALSGMGSDFKDVNNDGCPRHMVHRRGTTRPFHCSSIKRTGEFDDLTPCKRTGGDEGNVGLGERHLRLRQMTGGKDLFVARAQCAR